MTRQDVNRIFTEKVTSLIAQGYQINTGSMPGSQGEIAHVDLRKGSEIIRVLLESRCGFGRDEDYNGFFIITVGRNTDPYRDDRWDNTIWNGRLQIIEETRLARITNTYFVHPGETAPMVAKRLERWHAADRYKNERHQLGDSAKGIALRYIQRQPRMKNCKISEIESVRRVPATKWNVAHYVIRARGKDYTLLARPRRV